MLSDLITDATFQEDVVCSTWEELVDICGAPLVAQGSVQPRFLQSVKDTVHEFGSYMVLLDDIVFFHGRPEAGVNEISMSLSMLREPVFLDTKRILAAFMFAAVDNESHIDLLGELGEQLDDEEFLYLLRNHGSKAEIFKKIGNHEKKEE